jgi:membrane-associated phospholipid phosphatase
LPHLTFIYAANQHNVKDEALPHLYTRHNISQSPKKIMLRFLKFNSSFLSVTISFIIVGLYILFQINKGDETLFFSHHRTLYTNYFFRAMTKLGEALPYIIGSIFLLFRRYRYTLMTGMIALVVTVIAAIIKDNFGEPRPFTYFSGMGRWSEVQVVDGVFMLKGLNSFPSGHTMSAFAVYGFFAFILPAKHKVWGAALGLVACLVGISRMYLAQHFLKDVLGGAIIGIFIAIILYISQMSIRKQNRLAWWDKSLKNGKL